MGIDTAMILAAGYGTRLRPLTFIRPKPLFPVLGQTLLERHIAALRRAGIRRVVINTHYLAEMVEREAAVLQSRYGLDIVISPEKERILGGGGGLRRAADLLGGRPFLVILADIFSDLPLSELLKRHCPEALATLVLLDRAGGTVSLGEENLITAFRCPGRAPGEQRRLYFSGLMVLSPDFFQYPAEEVSDYVDTFNDALADGRRLHGWMPEKMRWRDIGTVADYLALNLELANGDDGNSIGPGAIIEPGAVLRQALVWPGVRVGAGAEILRSVVAADLPAGVKVINGVWPAHAA